MVVSRVGTPPPSGQTSLEFECFVNVFTAYDTLYSRTYRQGFLSPYRGRTVGRSDKRWTTEKVNFIHLPPGIDLSPEYQLFVFIRIYHVVKYLREHHPMRYHRMTEILKTISSVKLSSTFLLKVKIAARKMLQ